MTATSQERRFYPRVAHHFPLTIKEVNLYENLSLTSAYTRPSAGTILNVSVSGALIESRMVFAEKTVVNLHIDAPEWEKYKPSFFRSETVYPSPPLHLTGEVVRVNRSSHIGYSEIAVRFCNVDTLRKRALYRMLKAYHHKTNT